eukprot:3389561-Rhodomonas_salina.1
MLAALSIGRHCASMDAVLTSMKDADVVFLACARRLRSIWRHSWPLAASGTPTRTLPLVSSPLRA